MARPVIATARERFDRRWPELRRASGVLAESAPPEGWLKGLRRLLSMSSLMNSPRFSGSASVKYTAPMANGATEFWVQNNYTTSKVSVYDGLPQNVIPAINLVNATVTWRPADERWSAGLYGRNLTDRRYPGQYLYLPGVIYFASLGAPREYGVDFKFSW